MPYISYRNCVNFLICYHPHPSFPVVAVRAWTVTSSQIFQLRNEIKLKKPAFGSEARKDDHGKPRQKPIRDQILGRQPPSHHPLPTSTELR
ncbi:hypothetical protein QQP08_003423 [Theobroma cacao]|nr:hypothetical protein QQP08_003423 [Theobroma cacao]